MTLSHVPERYMHKTAYPRNMLNQAAVAYLKWHRRSLFSEQMNMSVLQVAMDCAYTGCMSLKTVALLSLQDSWGRSASLSQSFDMLICAMVKHSAKSECR